MELYSEMMKTGDGDGCPWVKAGLAAADRVSWRHESSNPTLHLKKWN